MPNITNNITNTRIPESNQAGNCCPNLGLEGDPFVCFAFPSESNYCYRFNEPEVVTETYQGNYCLTALFETCEIYKNTDTQQLSDEINLPPVNRKIQPLAIILPIVGLLIILIALYLKFSPDIFGEEILINSTVETSSFFISEAVIADQSLSTPEFTLEWLPVNQRLNAP